jgi:hypothetical protein
MRIARLPSVLILIALAGGCATPASYLPGQSGTELRARLGKPADVRMDRSGDELWVYTTGPAGTETWLFTVAPDGKIKAREQLLTQERFSRVAAGKTTKSDVRNLMGPPSKQMLLRSGEVWEWRMQDSPRLGHFAVRFGPGDVVAESMVLYDISKDSERSSER